MLLSLFHDLSSNRNSGMAPGPIPSQSIQAEVRLLELDLVEGDAIEWVIRQVDNWWLVSNAPKQ